MRKIIILPLIYTTLFGQLDKMQDFSKGFNKNFRPELLIFLITISLVLIVGFVIFNYIIISTRHRKKQLHNQQTKFNNIISKKNITSIQRKVIDEVIETCQIKDIASFLNDRKVFNIAISFFSRNSLEKKTNKPEDHYEIIHSIRNSLEFDSVKDTDYFITTKEFPIKTSLTLAHKGKTEVGTVSIKKENKMHIMFSRSVANLFPVNSKITVKHYNPLMGHYRFSLYITEILANGYEVVVTHHNRLPKPVQRKHQRIEVLSQVELYVQSDPNKKTGMLMDISLGGALINSSHDIKIGSTILLYATLYDRYPFSKVSCLIIRKKKNSDRFEYNIRFNEIDREQRLSIVEAFRFHQRTQKHASHNIHH